MPRSPLFIKIINSFLLNFMIVNYMLILLIIESLFLIAYLWYIIHTHASKDVTFYVKTLTLVSWLISFSLIIILPLDIYKVIKIMIYRMKINYKTQE